MGLFSRREQFARETSTPRGMQRALKAEHRIMQYRSGQIRPNEEQIQAAEEVMRNRTRFTTSERRAAAAILAKRNR